MINAKKVFLRTILSLSILGVYHRPASPKSPERVATAMQASFSVTINGAASDDNQSILFFIDPDRIIIAEPELSDHPGVDTTNQSLMLNSIGENKCRDKHNPASAPQIAYVQACGKLLSRTAESFVMEHVVRFKGVDGGEVVQQGTYSMQRSGITCQARLLSFQRTFRNMPGVFRQASLIKNQSCRAL